MNQKNRLLAVIVIFALSSLLSGVSATQPPDAEPAAAKKAADAKAAADNATVKKAAAKKALADKAAAKKDAALKAAAEKAAAEVEAAAAKAIADKEAADKAATERAAELAAQGKVDFSPGGITKAKEEAKALIAKGPPPGPPVLEPASYFLDKFRKKYVAKDVTGKDGAFTLSKGLKLQICHAIASAMREVANLPASTDPQKTIQIQWLTAEHKLIDQLGEPDEDGESLTTKVEKEIWRQFLNEWRDDVIKSDAVKKDPAKFKDALLQAAYELTKAVLDIQTAQEQEANKPSGSSSDTSSGGAGNLGVASHSGSLRADVFHARLMSGIYRRHGRHSNQIERISARR